MGGAYIRRGLAIEGNVPFLLCFTLYLRAISKYKPLGGLILFWRGDLTDGFLRYEWGEPDIWRGLFSEFYGIWLIFVVLRRSCTLAHTKLLL